jgi:poly-gamma-glutamate capsule biosynthesis protein CapA/YwtB (metallophosphatase superfamily)
VFEYLKFTARKKSTWQLVGFMAIVGLVVVVALFVFWFSYWTYYDPWVQVLPPLEVDFPASDDTTRVLFLGDAAPTDAALSKIAEHGYGYPFDATRSFLNSYDVVVANLEAPITRSQAPWPLPKAYVYKIEPRAVPEIKRSGIDIVTLANNHINDYRRRGIADTLKHLNEGGINHVGAGLSEAEARRGIVVRTPGGRLGILSYMQSKYHWRFYTMSFALDTPFRKWSGAARLGYRDLTEDIARLRRRSDAVVVVVHWGQNYMPIDAVQETLGRAAIDLGADAVIGHHPHQYQPVELYKGKPIIYSLGNYAFGTRGHGKMRYGMGAAVHLKEGRIAGVEFVPLLTQNRIVEYRPRIPNRKRRKQFFNMFIPASQKRGASITRQGRRGWLDLARPPNSSIEH